MARPHPVINQPAAEVSALDPLGDPRIVFVRHQERQSVIVQDPFDCSFPRGLLLPHLDQFAGKRKSVFVDLQFPAQVIANRKHVGRDVRTALFQGCNFPVDFGVLRAQLLERDGFVRDGILRLGLADLDGFAFRRDRGTIGRESIGVQDISQPGGAGQAGVLLRAPHALDLESFLPGDLPFEVLDTIAAVFCDRAFDFVTLMALTALLVVEPHNPLGKPVELQSKALATPFDEPRLHAGKEGA